MLPNLLLKNLYWALRICGAICRRVGMMGATRLHQATLASVGPGSRFQAGVRFAQPRTVSIGDECYFWRGCNASAEVADAPLIIGDRVQVNKDVHLDTTGGLTLGSRVLISEGAVIYTHDHGLDPRAAPQMMPKTIADDAWIGMRAIIMPQCRRIGRGAVIGAGAIVVHDVPPGAIVAGNPARVIGQKPLLAEVAA
ncbi:acyltransferase [Yoonia sp. R2-816]